MVGNRYRQQPTRAAEQVAASRARRIDGSPVGVMSGAEFRAAVQDPPEWLVLHAKKHSDMLVRLLSERGWGNPERLEAVRRWVDKHGANVTSRPEGIKRKIRGVVAYGNRNARTTRAFGFSENDTPLGLAVVSGDARLVEVMTKGAWVGDTHGVAFSLALETQQEGVLSMLWAMDPQLRRAPIGLEYALWSEIWLDRLVEKGMVIGVPTTLKAVSDWTGGAQAPLGQYELLAQLERINKADLAGRDPARRRVRGEKAAARVDWAFVCQWAGKHNMDVAVQWLKRYKADPVAFLLGQNSSVSKADLLVRVMSLMDNTKMRELIHAPNGLASWVAQGQHDWCAVVDRSLEAGITISVWKTLVNTATKTRGSNASLRDLGVYLDKIEITSHVADMNTVPAPRRRM